MVSSSTTTTTTTRSTSRSIEWWALVLSRSRMAMFGFTFGFLFRGPFLLTNDIMDSSSSRFMEEQSFEVPVLLRGRRKLLSQQHNPIQSSSSRRRERQEELQELSSSLKANQIQQKEQLPRKEAMPYEETITAAQQQRPDYSVTMDKTSHNVKQFEATYAKPADSTSAALEKEIKDFEKQDKVVIAIKIHGIPYLTQLKQSLCLLTAAYNNRVNYDILLFISEPLPETDVNELQSIVHPARLLVEQDKLTLEQHIEGLDQKQTARLLKRCNVTATSQLEWWTRCGEEGYEGVAMPLRYNWQAEFRSKWIWYNKQLASYRYMMWWDSDAMATKKWKQDPVAFMIRNKLKMFFDNFPAGTSKGPELKEKMMKAYNQNLCEITLVNGRLHPTFGNCESPSINQIHGFFHITDLDFYRSEENLKWFDILIGNAKFSRQWDDQLAVTVPAAMRAANESWSMNHHGVQLDIFHHQLLDGQRQWLGRGGYIKWYQNRSAIDFPESIDTCKSLVRNGG